MKDLKKIVISVLVILSSLFLFCTLRSIPAAKLWDGYSVVYVPAGADTAVVQEAFESAGCNDVISLENQFVPLAASAETPEVSLALSGLEPSSYLKKRLMYFFDKNHEYRLYYVPVLYVRKAEAAVKFMNSRNITAAVNVSAAYPFFVPIVCLIFAGILVWFSDRRILCAFSLCIPVFFSFTQPFYSAAAALCLFMYGIFLSLKVWKRNNALPYLFRNRLLIAFSAVSVLCMFLTGIKCGMMFLLLTASQCAVFFLMSAVSEVCDRRYSFRPVKIIPARMISLSTEKSLFCLLVCSCAIAALFLFAVMNVRIIRPSSEKSLQLPSPYGTGNLPTIHDFVNWRWETLTYPYISLNESSSDRKKTNPKEGDSVSFMQYSQKNGKIQEIEKSIVYGRNFIDDSLKSVENLAYPAVEKMLGKNSSASAGYVISGMQAPTVLNVLILILSFCIALFFYIAQKQGRRIAVPRGVK